MVVKWSAISDAAFGISDSPSVYCPGFFEMTLRSDVRWLTRLLVLPLLGLTLSGCQQGARNLTVDKQQALAACDDFLTAWKEGQSASDLQPGIIGSDYEWNAGKKLVSFEILPNDSDDGANLHIPVRLTLKNEQGQETQSQVMYVVSTSPSVTVFRDGND